MAAATGTSGGYQVVRTLYDAVIEEDSEQVDADAVRVIAPTVLAQGVRVSVVADKAGRRAVVYRQASKVRVVRAAGGEGVYWRTDLVRSVFRARNTMVIRRVRMSGNGRGAAAFSERLFGTDPAHAAGVVARALGNRNFEDCFEPIGELPAATQIQVRGCLLEVVGSAPLASERFPLLGSADSDGFATSLDAVVCAGAHYQAPWLDSVDAGQVAKKMFGARNYRRPLAQQIVRVDHRTLRWYSLFRSLVPPEWIIDALRRIPDAGAPSARTMTVQQGRTVRALLERTPQPVLRRMLRESTVQMITALDDAARSIRDSDGRVQFRGLDEVAAVLAATGQRNIRGSGDLHDLVRSVPAVRQWRQGPLSARRQAAYAVMGRERDAGTELERINCALRSSGGAVLHPRQWAQLDAPGREELRKRCELVVHEQARQAHAREAERHEQERVRRIARERNRAQWASALAEKITDHGTLGGLEVIVATDGQQLIEWGARMRNCIGGYHREIGLDVLLGLFRDGELVANAEINNVDGLVQLLGRHNQHFAQAKDLGVDLGRAVLADLAAVGVPACPHGWGLEALTEPTPTVQVVGRR